MKDSATRTALLAITGRLTSCLLAAAIATNSTASVVLADPPASTAACQFVFGFKALHDAQPDLVGDCIDNQAFTALGDSVQHTSHGLLLWRKPDAQVSFTDGGSTWLSGPCGPQVRLNSQRFQWEAQRPGCEIASPSDANARDLVAHPEDTQNAAASALIGEASVARTFHGAGYSLVLPPGWIPYGRADIRASFGTFLLTSPTGGPPPEVSVILDIAHDSLSAETIGASPITTALGQQTWGKGNQRVVQGASHWALVRMDPSNPQEQALVDSLWVE